jgi:lipoyl(octanoyl) transferase
MKIHKTTEKTLSRRGFIGFSLASVPGLRLARRFLRQAAAPAGVEAKIAALGLKVRNGCTYHGLAVNIAMDLAPFADIDPCGFPGLVVTQLADLGVARTLETAGAELAPMLARQLTRR